MRFAELDLPGTWRVSLDRHEDERGWFARSFCDEEFDAHGLNPGIAQMNLSFTTRRGTVRGLHWQATPSDESKLVCCLSGSVWDVLVDLRPGSPTRLRWVGVDLDRPDVAVYVPPGVAHGFQTMTDDVLMGYAMGAPYAPELARGARYDDPAFAVRWPLPITTTSERDRGWPAFDSTAEVVARA